MAQPKQDEPVQGDPRLGPRDGWIALAWCAAAAVLYVALRQERAYGDGSGLVNFTWTDGGGSFHHVLYLPVTRALAGLLGPGDRLLPLQLASALPAALGVGGAYLVFRRLGGTAALAAAGALGLALTPAYLFFATSVEVHGLHAGIAPLVLLMVLSAPFRRPVAAFALTGLGLAALYGTHQTGALLGLGLLFFFALGAVRAGRPVGWPTLLFGVGPALLGVLLLAMTLCAWYRFGSPNLALELGGSVDLADGAAKGAKAGPLERLFGAVGSLGLAVPLAALGLLRRPPRGWELAAPLAFFGVPFAVVVAWGVLERGAYFTALLAPLLWLGLRALPGRPTGAGWALLGAALLVQGALGLGGVKSYDRGYRLEDRWEALRAATGLAEPRGHLLTVASLAPSARLWFPGVTEHALGQTLAQVGAAGASPEAMAAGVAALDVLLGREPVVLDATVHVRRGDFPHTPFRPYFDALFGAIEREFAVEVHRRGTWEMWRLERRPGSDAPPEDSAARPGR